MLPYNVNFEIWNRAPQFLQKIKSTFYPKEFKEDYKTEKRKNSLVT